jgi:hypothetical protein
MGRFRYVSLYIRNDFEDEVNRRIQLGWAAFGKLRLRFFIVDPTKPKDESL